jgi:hypothetical protein
LYPLLQKDSTDNKENEGVEESGDAVLTLPDADTISGILETIAISWAGIKDQLDKVLGICTLDIIMLYIIDWRVELNYDSSSGNFVELSVAVTKLSVRCR